MMKQLIEKLTSRKFLMVVFGIAMLLMGYIPMEKVFEFVLLILGYLASEGGVDIVRTLKTS